MAVGVPSNIQVHFIMICSALTTYALHNSVCLYSARPTEGRAGAGRACLFAAAAALGA